MTAVISSRRPTQVPHSAKRTARQSLTELMRSIKSGHRIADADQLPDIGDSEFPDAPAHPKRWPADLD